MTLSDFDQMKHQRLPNWGRWTRHDIGKPDPDAIVSSIYSRGKDDETERDPDAAPEPPPAPIDEPDALWIDMLLLERLAEAHRTTIRNRYYRMRAVNLEAIDAAVRAILDAEEVAKEGPRAA